MKRGMPSGFDDLDCGRMGLEEYTTETLLYLYRPQKFTRDAFREFMYSQSKPFLDVLKVAEEFAADRTCFMAVLNK